jgi:anthranilate synthase component 2
MEILLIDNYDSFTYNLFHILEQYENSRVTVVRNDEIDLRTLQTYDAVVVSPGPGLPSSAGLLMEALRFCVWKNKVLGVCLGHQAIAELFGARLVNLSRVYHGVGLYTCIVDRHDPIFRNLPEKFVCGRYHSWVVEPKNLPEEIRVIAVDDESNIMAIRHVNLPVWGIQFHPESILTEYGKELIFNWLSA